MKRYLLIEVDCGGKKCKECDQQSPSEAALCEVFGDLDIGDKGVARRRIGCLDAERAAATHIGKDVELPSEDEIEAWNRCRATTLTSPHAAEHLCEAIDLVRRLKAVRDAAAGTTKESIK